MKSKLYKKLRRGNSGQYKMLGGCIFLSILLITSFSLMYLGPTVQNFLPEGGDTRKMASLLLAVTAVGCSVFTLYASNLFFRYKSREYGIFLALGESKKALARSLFRELAAVTVTASLIGFFLAVPASWLIWKLFETFLISTEEMSYQFGFRGFFAGLGFALFLCLLLGLAGGRFVKRSDIMDILNTQHKTEMVKMIRPWTLPVGIICIVLGLFLGIGLPSIAANVFHQQLPGITNLFYLLTLIGIYLVLLNIVAQNRLGKNKEKFYKNMVSVSMMRFFAKSTTRNMCVIVLLLFTCMFATFYGLLYSDSAGIRDLTNSKSFAMHSPSEEKQITQEEIYDTAAKYHMTIEEFGETEAADLIISYINRDLNDNGQYITVKNEQAKLALFFSAETYQAVTGRSVEITPGTYKTVTVTDYKENIWDFSDGLWEVRNPDTGKTVSLTNDGTVEYDAIAAMSNPYAYILSDQDYAEITSGISPAHTEHVVLFNVADFDRSYPFAMDLLTQYVNHASALSSHLALYDAWEEARAEENGEEYPLGDPIDLSIDNTMLLSDWKYAPSFAVITSQNFMQMISIYVMLCLYIFIITLAAAAIMTYVRSIAIASDNRELFQNLKKLGADDHYQRNILKKQLNKIFQYPAILGCSLGLLFSLFICWFNDGRFTASEFRALLVLLSITALILAFLYVVYRKARNRAEGIVGLR